MIGADDNHSEAVRGAAQWLADQNPPPHPVVFELRQRFNLTALEACEACAVADRYRLYRKVHG